MRSSTFIQLRTITNIEKKMRRLFIIAVLTAPFTLTHQAYAKESVVELDGESFISKFSSNPANGDKLLEFIRENETLENWTKLVGYRYQQLPGVGNDPVKLAQSMAMILKARGHMSQVTENKRLSEAMIDFITGPKNGILEFNIFRYAKSANNSGIISLQFAHRFTDTSSASVERILKLRDTWIRQAVVFDMKTIQDALIQ
jgi:hypothetical protein